jgi:PAP2 superfamily
MTNQPVLYWNEALLEANARDHTPGQRPERFSKAVETRGPTGSSRAFAIVHLAMRDAAVATTQPNAPTYTGVPYTGTTGTTARNAAIAAAAQCTLAALYPEYEDFFVRHATDDPMPDGPGLADGHRLGAEVARVLLQKRAHDGAGNQPHYAASSAYGHHREDPVNPGQGFLGPQWGNVQHFVLPPEPVKLDPPPGSAPDFLADPHYKADHDEVRELGVRSGGKRTPDQTLAGTFWAYDGAAKIGTPPRLYNQILRKIVEQKIAKNENGDAENQAKWAEFFALANVAMAEAGIEAWRWKYHYDLWRPVIGIREACRSNGPSGQPGTNDSPDCDPFWQPLGAPNSNQPGTRDSTPPFPSYPSGHATFGAAVFQTVRLFFGGAAITIEDVLDDEPPKPELDPIHVVSDELNGTTTDSAGVVRVRHTRTFTDLVSLIKENALSRVYLGVHWRFDGLPRDAKDEIGGVPLGLKTAKQVCDIGLVRPDPFDDES